MLTIRSLRKPAYKMTCLVLLCLATYVNSSCGDSGAHDVPADGRIVSRFDLVPIGHSNSESLFLAARPLRLAVNSKGHIYVADVNRIHVLTGDGTPLMMVGREGEGPGEFGFIWNLQTLPGDSLLVYDTSLQRITVFPPDAGRAAYTVNVTASYPIFWVERIVGTGEYLAVSQAPFRSTVGDAVANRKEVVHVLDSNGGVRRDSVFVVPAEQSIVARNRAAVAVAPDPFGRRPLYKLGVDGAFYYGWSDSTKITVYDNGGHKAQTIALPDRRMQVSSAELDRIVRAHEKMFHEALLASAPRTWAIIRNIIVDDVGNAWVAFSAAPQDSVEWIVYDKTGRTAGRTLLPGNVDLKVVRNRLAYGVSTDDNDVPRVEIYHVDNAIAMGRD